MGSYRPCTSLHRRVGGASHSSTEVRMAARPLRSLSSVAKGASLPSPSGHYAVGCVDLMHKCEGDSDGLLMRLFYPAMAGHAGDQGRQFARWMPHMRYASTTFDFIKVMVPGFSSNAMEHFTSKSTKHMCILLKCSRLTCLVYVCVCLI